MSNYPLVSKLEKLNRNLQIFFAIVCADRCVRIFDYNFNEGSTELKDAINACLANYVNIIDRENLLSVKASLENAIPILDEVGSQHSCSVYAGTSILCVIDAVLRRELALIINSLNSALEAVDSFSEYNGKGIKDELEWQSTVLGRLSKIPAEFDEIEFIKQINEDTALWESEWV